MGRPNEQERFRLDGQVAVVIGGTGSIGGCIADALAGTGAHTVVVGRDRARGEAAVDRMRANGGRADLELCDVVDHAALPRMVERILDRCGRVDVLVNSAGANAPTPFLEIEESELERVVASNQTAVFLCCQAFGRYFVERATRTGEGASIINIGSVSGLTPLSSVFTYSMAKAAVHNLTKNLAREWGPLGIRCNVLVPGFFPAEQNRRILVAERVRSIVAHTPLGRLGEVDDLAGAALLLASDAGRFITGTELVVDGGFGVVTI